MEIYFKQRDPAVFNINNAETVNSVFRRFIDEIKGEIEAWSQIRSGWVVKAVLEAFIKIAYYQPFRGVATYRCLKSCKTKTRSSTSKTGIISP